MINVGIRALLEFLGTFIFLFVILQQGQPIPIAVALLAVIYAFGSISGGHFNPAVTVMMGVHQKISTEDAAVYIVAQILGGILAVIVYKQLEKMKEKTA
jgi:glycerol uptake facilitator-like aquaporin